MISIEILIDIQWNVIGVDWENRKREIEDEMENFLLIAFMNRLQTQGCKRRNYWLKNTEKKSLKRQHFYLESVQSEMSVCLSVPVSANEKKKIFSQQLAVA